MTAEGQPGVIDRFARAEHWPIGIACLLLAVLDVEELRRRERVLLDRFVDRLPPMPSVPRWPLRTTAP